MNKENFTILLTLYKQTKTGAIQQYTVMTKDNLIVVEQGQVDGAKQYYETFCEGKNIGRGNETSPSEQAVLEAQSKHNKKIKSGYTLDKSGEILLDLPMKVKTYQDQLNNIPEQVYVSPKLNGVNAEFRLKNNKLILLSRGGNEYPMLEHLVEPVTKLLRDMGTTRIAGELYIHGEYLQNIIAAVKKKNDLTHKIGFHVFDLPLLGGDYETRRSFMNGRISNNDEDDNCYEHIYRIPSNLISKKDIDKKHSFWTEVDFEGIVIYDPIGLYEYNVRSSYVWKYKIPKDAEFKVIDYSIDKLGHVVFVCSSNHDDKTFKVKLKGTKEERLAMAQKASTYIGKWLKVEFEMYSKDAIPQKPVGIMFRECDFNGEPIE